MNRSNIIKVCLLSIGALIILCAFIMMTGKKDHKDENILSTDKNKSYTLDDMAKNQNAATGQPSGSVAPSATVPAEAPQVSVSQNEDGYQNETSDVKKVEKVLRQTRNTNAQPSSHRNLNVSSKTIAPAPVATSNTPIVAETKPVASEISGFKQPRHRGGTSQATKSNVTPAVIQGEQTVKDKSTVRIRLLEDFLSQNGAKIPKNTSVYGIVNIASDRLYISINSVLLNGSIINLNANVYDIDGQKGINIQSNINREISNDATDAAVNSYTPTSTGVAGAAVSALTSVGRSAISRRRSA